MFEVARLLKPLRCECRRGTAVRVVTTIRSAVAVGTIVGHVSAACSLFQADQLHACLLAISGRSETEVLYCVRDRESSSVPPTRRHDKILAEFNLAVRS